MFPTTQQSIKRRTLGKNVWLNRPSSRDEFSLRPRKLEYEVLPSEEAVGRVQFDEIVQAARNKQGPLVIVLLGGRGAKALHRFFLHAYGFA